MLRSEQGRGTTRQVKREVAPSFIAHTGVETTSSRKCYCPDKVAKEVPSQSHMSHKRHYVFPIISERKVEQLVANLETLRSFLHPNTGMSSI